MPADQASVLDNFLIRPGKIIVRGGFKVVSNPILTTVLTPFNPVGWVVDKGFLFASKNVSAGGQVDPWNAPLLASTSASLASGVTTMVNVQNAGAPSALTAANADQIIGPRWINFDGLLYGISYDSAGTAVQDAGTSYFMKPLSLLTLAPPIGAGAFPSLPTVLSNAPHGAFDLKGHQGRIWLLGGIDTPGSGTKHLCNALFFTNGVNTSAGVGTATSDWQDPVAGTTNIIKMDNNTADYGVALAQVRNGLLILRRSSLWFLRGTTTANYTVYPISKETGCLDARSVVETDHGVYFIGPKGLMLTDGVKVVNVSGAVTYTLQLAIATQQNSILASQGGYITCGLTSQGQILISIGTLTSTGLTTIWSGLYDPAAAKGGAWVRITSQLWLTDAAQGSPNNSYPGPVIWQQSPHQVYIVGNKYLTQLEDSVQNYSFLLQSQLYDAFATGAQPYVSIPAKWKTKLYPIAGVVTNTRRYGIAKRYFIDHVFAANGLVPATGWTVTPVNASDTNAFGPGATTAPVLHSTLGNPPATSGSVSGVQVVASPSIQRDDITNFNVEIDDVGFDVTWTDVAEASQPTNVLAEIYGIGLEWQKSRER